MDRFLVYLFLSLNSLSFARGSAMFSSNCRDWKPLGESDGARMGFLKTESEKLYFDLSKNLWIQLGSKPLAFIENDNEVFILTDSTIESHTLRTKHQNEVLKLLETLLAVGKEMATEHRWALRSKNGQTQLAAFFTGSSKCSVEPKALIVVCTREKACLLGPNANEPQKNAKACVKELGLLETSRFDRLSRACESVSKDTAYKSIDEGYQAASVACGQVKSPLLSLKLIKAMCRDAGHLLKQLY